MTQKWAFEMLAFFYQYCYAGKCYRISCTTDKRQCLSTYKELYNSMLRIANMFITLMIQCKTSYTMVAYEHVPESYKDLLQKPHISNAQAQLLFQHNCLYLLLIP